jgi:flavorubredoxin
MKKITDDIYYIGYNNIEAKLFENQFPLKHGMAYNSYLILDDKVAVIDSVEIDGKEIWFNNIEEVLKGRTPEYLIVEHVEPDHSGSILDFIKKYPTAKIITTKKALDLLNQFFDYDFNKKVILVNEKDTIDLGKHTLEFYLAPMVHWPEVMMVYDKYSKTFFSADAFGKFGVINADEHWLDEARRYYVSVVSKYGFQVQNILHKIENLDIKRICALHGPILDENLSKYINYYDKWSRYESENTDGVLIVCSSVYGNTKKAALKLKEKLIDKGVQEVLIKDLSSEDLSKVLSEAFKFKKIVLASTTYNNSIFPLMHDFLTRFVEHNIQNKTIGIIENGSWVPQVEKIIKNMLNTCKNIKFIEKYVSIKSSLKANNLDEIDSLAGALKGE